VPTGDIGDLIRQAQERVEAKRAAAAAKREEAEKAKGKV